MEENTVELADYFRVIWKRKILIIVVTFVCIGVGVGVGVTNSMSRSPVTYYSNAVVKVGQKLKFAESSGVNPIVEYIESPSDLEGLVPRKYGFKVIEATGYDLVVNKIGNLPMIELTMKGPDRGVGRVLKETVDLLIDDHNKKSDADIALYLGFVNKLEADVKMFQENIAVIETTIKGLKRRRGVHLENMVVDEADIKEGNGGGGQSAFLNMLYLKTIDKEGDLSTNRSSLRNSQWKLILFKTTLGERKKYQTKMIGEIRSVALKPEKKSFRQIITVAGVAGLMMSFFIIFFMEYLGESKARRKGK